jgi:TetR/AcrR family tetracycline transcriptional repressor
MQDPARRRGRRRLDEGPALDRERLVAALLAIAEKEGLAAINMRRVAADLGVSPRLIYHHVKDKEEMLFALYDEIWARNMPDLEGLDWDDRLREIAAMSRRALARYPGAAAGILASSSGRITLPHSAQVREAVVSALTDAGLRGDAVEAAYVQFVVLTLGGAVMSEGAHAKEAIEASIDQALDRLFSGVR